MFFIYALLSSVVNLLTGVKSHNQQPQYQTVRIPINNNVYNR